MTTELTVLILSTLLTVVQLLLYAVPANLELGVDKTAGPRDEPLELKTATTGRLKRAYENQAEWLLPFAIAALTLYVTDQGTNFTGICAWVYLAARVLYVPAYVYAWTPGRTVIFMFGFGATLMMLFAALF